MLTLAEFLDAAEFYVDWREMLYYGPGTGENVWDWLFEQSPPPEGEVLRVAEWPHYDYTWKHATDPYGETAGRPSLHRWWRALRVRPEFPARAAAALAAAAGRPLTGVLVRADPLAEE